MSPHAALASGIFRNYCFIGIGILAVAGLVLAILKLGLKRPVGTVWTTYRSWLVMAPVAVGCVFAGRVTMIVFVCLLAALAFKEFARATGLYRDWGLTGVGYLGVAAVGFAALVPQPRGLEVGDGWYGFFCVLPVFVISAIMLVPILRNEVSGQFQMVSLAIVGFTYLGWMFGHLAFLANATDAYGYILYLLFATELNDVAAFTFGKTFGRHPLRSKISPKKTWEGALGALAVSMALPWLLRFSFPFFGPTQLILAGLIVGIGGQLGDLAISMIKRDIGIKDMGAGIPGHGGILDRIDSLVYTVPLFFHMAGYYYGIK